MELRKVKRFLRKETGSWFLMAVTLLMAGFSVWTSNYLYRTRNQTPAAPVTTEAAANCTLNFSLDVPEIPPCEPKIDLVGLSIDRSSSMNQTDGGRRKLEWAKEAAGVFIDALDSVEGDRISVSINSFGAQGNDGRGTRSRSYDSILHNSLTSNFGTIRQALNDVRYREVGTCVECGIRIANSQVTPTRDTKKVAVLISDGMANRRWDGSSGTAEAKRLAIEAAERGRELGVEYHVIGYGEGTQIDHNTLRAIAGSNGSYQYKPKVKDWTAAFLQIFEDICKPTSPTPTSRATSTPTSRMTPTPTSRQTPTPTRRLTATPTIPVGSSQVQITEDSFVSSGSPKKNYGSVESLYSNGSPTKLAYLKIDLSSVTSTVGRAILRIYMTNKSAGTVNVRNVSGSWSESTVTYNNRPTLGSIIRSFTPPSTAGVWVDIDITSFVNSNRGRVAALAIESTKDSDDLIFRSTEATSNRPQIVIQ